MELKSNAYKGEDKIDEKKKTMILTIIYTYELCVQNTLWKSMKVFEEQM